MLMEKNNSDFNNLGGFYGCSPFSHYEGVDTNFTDNMFNPVSQYEQGYMYYRYLTQAVEYKIKCKELEKMNEKDTRTERRIN